MCSKRFDTLKKEKKRNAIQLTFSVEIVKAIKCFWMLGVAKLETFSIVCARRSLESVREIGSSDYHKYLDDVRSLPFWRKLRGSSLSGHVLLPLVLDHQKRGFEVLLVYFRLC